VLYYTLTVGGGLGATLGMRWCGIQVRDWQGGKPSHLHAFIASALYWVFVPATSGLILLVGVFNNRRRQVHDMLSGTVVVRTGVPERSKSIAA